MSTKRKAAQDEGRGFKQGAYGAHIRLVLAQLKKYSADGPGPEWSTWQPWAVRELSRGLRIADAVVDAQSNAAAKAANSRRTPAADETPESLIARRDAFSKKHGKTRGWKTAAAMDVGISVDAMTDLCRKHGVA